MVIDNLRRQQKMQEVKLPDMGKKKAADDFFGEETRNREIRNKWTTTTPLASPLNRGETTTDDDREMKGRGMAMKKLRWVAVGVVVLVVVAVGFYFLFWGEKGDKGEKVVVSGESSGWQAVFLVSGSVYFGKIKKLDDDFIVVTDVYYLRSEKGEEGLIGRTGQEGEGADESMPGTVLVKFGTEMHKPVDELKINKEQVLMIEELSTESRIIQAIESYEKGE